MQAAALTVLAARWAEFDAFVPSNVAIAQRSIKRYMRASIYGNESVKRKASELFHLKLSTRAKARRRLDL